MAGSKVRVWKQDPSVTAIGVRSAYIHSEVSVGPRDGEIEVRAMPTVHPNACGDFLFLPAENALEFDAVHTFAVVRQVLTMYRRAMDRIGLPGRARWQWEDDAPIYVYPRAGLDANAYYSRAEQSLAFYYFHPHDDESRPLVYTCRSLDLVAHETGHAILDALRPGYWASWHPQTGGLHESFGDLTAIFTMLAQMDQCEAIIAESKADLHAKSFFPAVAEQFGEALYGHSAGLRNADNDLRLSEVGTGVHALSQVFTGGVYDILADIFEDYVRPDQHDPAETLFRVGKHMTALLVLALATGPDQNATFSQIAARMIAIEPREPWKRFIEQRFAEREVDARAPVGIAPAEPEHPQLQGCCGTLRHATRLGEVEAAIEGSS